MTHEMTRTKPAGAADAPGGGFSAAAFAAFWAAPDLTAAPSALTPDVVGYWPGSAEPVRGTEEYVGRLADLLQVIPDLHLEVAEHAENGPHVFVRWIARGTGPAGPLEFAGIDRILVRDGLVAENVVVFDTAQYEKLVGAPLPWS